MTIGRALRQIDRATERLSIIDSLDSRAEGASSVVERYATEGIMDITDIVAQLKSHGYGVATRIGSRAEIYPLTIGRETREGFESRSSIAHKRRESHSRRVEVGNTEIARSVEHLETTDARGMERRNDDIGREDSITARRMTAAGKNVNMNRLY